MSEPGGPGVPAGVRSLLEGEPLMKLSTWPLRLRRLLLLENRKQESFLDCSKCYERIPLQTLETFALESGYPMYALYAALDMYSGRRRVLLQGAVSEPVTATHGMPPGCGHAVDLLHAFLLKTLKSTGRHVTVRKYVDDMVLVASGALYPEAPFRLGSHLRVVRHEDFLQSLSCDRQTGKVWGEYNFAYMTRQTYRRLKKRKQKKRRTGFGTTE
eukprot:668889-Amphidinium_carterae.1